MAISRAEMNNLLKRLEKPVQKAFLDAVYQARSFAKIKALVAAIQTGNIHEIVRVPDAHGRGRVHAVHDAVQGPNALDLGLAA